MVIIYPLGNSDIQKWIKDKDKNDRCEPLVNKNEHNKITFRNATKEILDYLNDSKNIVTPRTLHNILGFEILDQNNNYIGRYAMPIFSTVYSKLVEKSNREKITFYFIVTDQKNEKQPEGNSGDTIYEYQIFETLFNKERFKRFKKFDMKSFIINDNPTDMDFNFKNIEKLREKLKLEGLLNDEIKVIFGPGVPQVSSVLILKFFDLENAEFYYPSKKIEQDKDNECATELKQQKVPGVIHSVVNKNALKNLIDSFNYISAYEFLKNSKGGEKEELLQLLEVIYNYSLFRFEDARNSFKKFKNNYLPHQDDPKYDPKQSIIDLLENELDGLAESSIYYKYNLLSALVNIMQIYFESEMFNEWIALTFRVEEELGKIVAEKLLRVTIEKEDRGGKKGFFGFNEAIKNNGELLDFLRKEGIRESHNGFEPNREVYIKIVNFFRKTDKTPKREKDIASYFIEMVKLFDIEKKDEKGNKIKISDLRNTSPFAHGFRGINRKMLEDVVKPKSIDEILFPIVDNSSKLLNELSNGSGERIKRITDENFIFRQINKLLTEAYLE